MNGDFNCRPCGPAAAFATADDLEHHLVKVHRVARDAARAAIVAAMPTPASAVRPPETEADVKTQTCRKCGKPGHKIPTCPEAGKNVNAAPPTRPRGRRRAKRKGGGKFQARRPRAEARNGGTPARAAVKAMFADLERELAAARAEAEANAERVDGLARVIHRLRTGRA